MNTNQKKLKFPRINKPHSVDTILGMLNNDQKLPDYHRRKPGEDFVLTIVPEREFRLARVGWRVPRARIDGKQLTITMPENTVVMFCYVDKPQKVVVIDSNP